MSEQDSLTLRMLPRRVASAVASAAASAFRRADSAGRETAPSWRARRAQIGTRLTVSFSVLLIAGCGGHGPEMRVEPDLPALRASVGTVEEATWPEMTEIAATVQPMRRAMPGTVLMGRVDRVLRREGDRVAAQDVLASIESREVAARLAQAEAAVGAARANELNARLMKERMEKLYAHQAASRKNLDDAIAGYESAQANARVAEEGVKAARMYVSYSEVKAPFAGVITERHVETGDMASPGMPLFVVEDLSRVKVEGAVPESVALVLRPGTSVDVDLTASGAGVRSGTLAEILPAADPGTRTFTVRVVLENPDGMLRSGMFARLLLGGAARSTVAVPETALVRQGPLTGIYTVDGEGIARLRWVTSGRSRSGWVEVLTGLGAGEKIVKEPPPGLVDGRRVEAS